MNKTTMAIISGTFALAMLTGCESKVDRVQHLTLKHLNPSKSIEDVLDGWASCTETAWSQPADEVVQYRCSLNNVDKFIAGLDAYAPKGSSETPRYKEINALTLVVNFETKGNKLKYGTSLVEIGYADGKTREQSIGTQHALEYIYENADMVDKLLETAPAYLLFYNS